MIVYHTVLLVYVSPTMTQINQDKSRTVCLTVAQLSVLVDDVNTQTHTPTHNDHVQIESGNKNANMKNRNGNVCNTRIIPV